jgi:hypothetical protein
MDKLKKLLCCLWSTPTAILIATILYLYADRNEYISLKEDKFNRPGSIGLVTNKWTGNTCVFTTSDDAEGYTLDYLDSYPTCNMMDLNNKSYLKMYFP